MISLQVPLEFNPSKHPDIKIDWYQGLFRVIFEAMASPCELLIELENDDLETAKKIALLAAIECWRIEFKFSRYQKNNFFSALHSKPDQWFKLDGESERLINFADSAWYLSDGLFDISSGILRKVWSFKKGSNIPQQVEVDSLLNNIGWQNVSLHPTKGIKLPLNMELDFGGIGKEYAVDRVLQLINQNYSTTPLLVNFGGDIACNMSRKRDEAWLVGIKLPDYDNSQVTLSLKSGALATSGDSQRHLIHNKKRYSHVLNPKTGWPIEGAPRSITLAAPTCIQAGLIATLTLLQGQHAESYVKQTGFTFWLYN